MGKKSSSYLGIFLRKRDIRDKDIHPAVFPIALPKKCIELFTHEGELVLDPFAGIGTTLIAAKDLKRNAVGFDLNERYVEFANKRLADLPHSDETKQIEICDDAINIPKYLEKETVSLCITSPPYANMLNRERLNKSIRSDLRKINITKKSSNIQIIQEILEQWMLSNMWKNLRRSLNI